MNWLLMVNFASYLFLLLVQAGCETDAGFLVIVLVGKPLKAKGLGDIIYFELKVIFCSCLVVSVFLKFF